MDVSIAVLPLCEKDKAKLKNNGFLSVRESLSAEVRATVLSHLSAEEFHELTIQPVVKSAWEIYEDEESRQRIATFSQQLDTMLGGGIQLQAITDFCGAPGTGKTQICHQLCIDVQLPEQFGGVSGQALFIDTNHSFSKNRLKDIAEASVEYCEMVKRQRKLKCDIPCVDDLLKGVLVLKSETGNLDELLAIVTNLRETLYPKIRLIVIDSFSKPFLLHCEDTLKRTALIFETLSQLQTFATEFNNAIVTTSQLTTVPKIDSKTEYNIVPGLGQGFAHRLPNRVLLGLIYSFSKPRRAAQMYKSSSQPNSSAYFQILKSGIRDEGME